MLRPGHVLVLIAALMAAVYYPALTSDYAMRDDFGMRLAAQANPMEDVRLLSHDGRFFYSWWLLGPLGAVKSMQGFKYVRLLTVLGIFCSTVCFFVLVRRWLVRDVMWAGCLAALFAVNPGFLVLGGWAGLGLAGWAVFPGLLAGLILLKKPEGVPLEEPGLGPPKWPGPPIQIGVWRAILGGLCLLVSLLFYQSSAMAVWLAVGLWLLNQFDGSRQAWKALIIVLVVFTVATLISLVAAHWMAQLFSPGGNRLGIAIDFPHRLTWFIHRPLSGVFQFPFLRLHLWLSALLGLPLIAGFIYYIRRYASSKWTAPFFLAMAPLCMLPTMVAAMYYDVFRTRVALYGYGIILWSLVFTVWSTSPKRVLLARRFLMGATLAAAVFGQFNLLHYLVIPRVVEESVILARLREYVALHPNLDHPIWVRPIPAGDSFAGAAVTDEWGGPDTDFTPESVIQNLLADVAQRPLPSLTKVPITIAPAAAPPGAFEIDLQHVRVAR